MGIPHLITFLQPYAEAGSIAGSHVVIDGPGLAYYIYYTCLSARSAASTPFEAAPSYEELGEACLAWLDGLRDNDVEVKKIYFDGFLPHSKLDTRLERLMKQTKQLNQYHSLHSTPCRASLQPLDRPLGEPFRHASVKAKLAALPPSAFLVPAVLETLLESTHYGTITEVVPGEADLYCARYLNQNGGIVLTGDSDLLVHDLGKDGAVCFFKDIWLSKSGLTSTLQGEVYTPAAIARRLKLPDQGLHAFAFEISIDSHGTFRKLLVDAQALKAAKSNPSEFRRFLKAYTQLPAPLLSKTSTKMLLLLRSLDPRISEYALQYAYIAHIAEQNEVAEDPEALHIFLPFLLDCPTRTNAWEVSTAIRQLAYGLINIIVPEAQQRMTVSEHRKQQDKSSGRELQLPSLPQIPEACIAVTALHAQLKQRLPGLSNVQIWTAISIHQEVEYSHCRSKTTLSHIILEQLADLENKSNMGKTFTWDIVHFFAQIQGSNYSFRILKQIMSLIVSHALTRSFPEPLLKLYELLESLPRLRDLPNPCDISTILGGLDKNTILEIIGLVSGTEEVVASPPESRRSLKKKRKREQPAIEPSAAHPKPNNMFELLKDQ